MYTITTNSTTTTTALLLLLLLPLLVLLLLSLLLVLLLPLLPLLPSLLLLLPLQLDSFIIIIINNFTSDVNRLPGTMNRLPVLVLYIKGPACHWIVVDVKPIIIR